MIKKDALTNINLNKNFINFKKEVINSVPKQIFSTPIEQAIFIYYYLCAYYDYDSRFYYSNQEGPSTEKHREFHLINNFDKNDRTAVCYDFDSIYYLIVNDIYPNVELINSNFANILLSDFDVHTDAILYLFDLDENDGSMLSSIKLQGSVDMTLLKTAYSNDYKSSPMFIDASNLMKEKFYEIAKKSISYLIENKLLINPVQSELFSHNQKHLLKLEIFDFVKDSDIIYDLDDIVNFMSGIQQIALKEMSYRKYAINLYKQSNLFNKDYFNFCIVKEKIAPSIFKPTVIISIQNKDKAVYYSCDFNKKLQKTSHQIIYNNFKNGIFDYYKDESKNVDYRFLIPFVSSNLINKDFENELKYYVNCDDKCKDIFLSNDVFFDNPKLIDYFKFYDKINSERKSLTNTYNEEKERT